MGRPYSDDLRERVVAAMEGGGGCRSVGATFGVAPSTAGRWHLLYKQTQSVSPRPMGGDHRSKLTGEAAWLAARLAEAPGLTLTDLRGELALRKIDVAYSTVRCTVRRLGLRFKKNDLRH